MSNSRGTSRPSFLPHPPLWPPPFLHTPTLPSGRRPANGIRGASQPPQTKTRVGRGRRGSPKRSGKYGGKPPSSPAPSGPSRRYARLLLSPPPGAYPPKSVRIQRGCAFRRASSLKPHPPQRVPVPQSPLLPPLPIYRLLAAFPILRQDFEAIESQPS
ncbi:hypothetical protein B0H12DRAFT_469466 [Mycena haematopus]|nr:hypothetical protein B0H12DRAFT_469466 [Mycena haematopus]